jgi:hypothetical protein
MEMTRSWDGFEVGKPLGKKNEGWSLQVSRLLSHRKANPNQNQKKKKMGKIQGVTLLGGWTRRWWKLTVDALKLK